MLPSPVTIVADDLTGSADSALPFWRAGLRTVVVFDPSAPWPRHPGALSICTHSRALDETSAAAVVAALAPRLPAGPRLFKKIDSTLRGWIGAEARTLLSARPDLRPVFAPAYPTKGRTLGPDGVYRVHGEPLAATEFAAEIAGLGADSRLDAFLRRHFGELSDRLRVLPAVTAAELDAAFAVMPEPALWIGSPGLGIALAGPGGRPPPPPPVPDSLPAAPIVVAAGSRRTLTQNQVAALTSAVRHAGGRDLVLLRPPDTAFNPSRALSLADDLGRRAATAAAAIPGDVGLILTGGDIAAATCRHLGITSAALVGEVEDGLPLLRSGRFVLVTKAGGFGHDRSLVRAYAAITSALR